MLKLKGGIREPTIAVNFRHGLTAHVQKGESGCPGGRDPESRWRTVLFGREG